ncbi:Ribosomal protein S18 acetylase RimI [Ruminococcus sp. YE71]|uniref:GNAT family N-acetyltransferase n=1 Tax=unclassified Ruminococcus TaxID=2608920 RepID=UPI000891307F|nr:MULTISPECIES: GNAT family N-acetyltransferase [unclassified Ruminococcus]SDA23990.1 Ribosomal protein S18 acetylase RimI [Ruminococcus sp. YE78]SFW40835.1 Ribosomal protein S18 acetylase RimI [Ruminococcus sp. YE71]
MVLERITADSYELDELERINKASFPENEYVNIRYLFENCGRGVLAVRDEGRTVGFIVVYETGEYTYICFFAIDPDLRGRGLGSSALSALAAECSGRCVVADIEAPDSGCENNAQRIRRREFYTRNGFSSTGWFMYYMDTEFEVMSAGGSFDMDGFRQLLAEITAFAPSFQPRIYRKPSAES